PAGLAFQKCPGLPLQQLIGQAFEALSDHHEPPGVRVARAKVEVREPAAPAPMAPLGAEHDEVIGADGLDLAPRLAAAAGGVERSCILDHDSLVAGAKRLVENALTLEPAGREDRRDLELRRD